MATKNGTGAAARPNPQHEVPREGRAGQAGHVERRALLDAFADKLFGRDPEPLSLRGLILEINSAAASVSGARALLADEPGEGVGDLIDTALKQLGELAIRLDLDGIKGTGSEGAPLRARPTKVKVDHGDAEFGYSWFAALNPHQRGACIDWFNSQAEPPLAASATPAPAVDPLSFTPDAERLRLVLEAAWQVDALVDTILGLVEPSTKGIAITGIAARIRDLSDATLSLIDDPGHSLPMLHRKVHGAFPEGEGEVS